MKMPVSTFTRKRWCFRSSVVSSVLLILLFQLATRNALAEDPLNKAIKLDIQENTRLEDALIDWGTTAGMTVMINTQTVSHQVCHGVHGTLSARKALLEILRDSGLSYTQEGERIRIVPAATIVHSVLRDRRVGSFSAESSGVVSDAETESGSSSVADDISEKEDETHRRSLPTVIVTAQKREEWLQDVPVPVTALNAENLVDTGNVRLADYYDSVPGLTFQPSAVGGYNLYIRGLVPPTGGSTVSVLMDGLPIGSGFSLPDLDPSILQRIEILRGPQGTLWGVNSIGGLLNFVTTTPSTKDVSGRVEADLSNVYNSDGPSYGGRGAVNLPLSDTLAILASGFARRDAGYIDNVETGERAVNWANVVGGRLSALWQPNESVSLQLRALLQDDTQHGMSAVTTGPGYGGLQQRVLRGAGWNDTRAEDFGAILNVKLSPSLEFASLTSYNSYRLSYLSDFTAAFQPLLSQFYGQTAAYTQHTYVPANNFNQELHLSAHLGQAVDWLMGGFYTHQSAPTYEDFEVRDPLTGGFTGVVPLGVAIQSKYEEIAAFTNITVHLDRRMDVQLGARRSHIRTYSQETDFGNDPQAFAFFGEGAPSPNAFAPLRSESNPFTYLITPSFKIAEGTMVYARVASGYQPGGPNAAFLGIPPEFKPSTSVNYELGLKGDAFDNRLTFDSSVYYIDWKDMQIIVTLPNGLGYIANAGGAKSEGVEMSLQAHPLKGSTIGGWVTWNEAILTTPIPTVGITLPSGQLAPTPRWSGNFSLQQEFPLGARLKGSVGGVVTYTGGRLSYQGPYNAAVGPQEVSSYTKIDLHADMRFDAWTVGLFANNITDRRGALVLTNSFLPPDSFGVITPRTIGLSVSRTF